MAKISIKDIGFIVLIAIVIWLYISGNQKDKTIHDLRVNSEYYQKQNETIELKIDSLRKVSEKRNNLIDSLNKVLTKTPKDADIIHENPIDRVSVNDSWGKIISPIEQSTNPSGE